MISTFNTLFQYIKSPDCNALEDISISKKINILASTLFISLVLCMGLAILIGIIDHFGFINMDKHASSELFDKYSKGTVFFLVVILAPVIEETIFRGPITLFSKYKKSFKYIFYGFALVFGYIHIFNFEVSTSVILLSPILVAPQILLGLFLGYIRVKLGLIYSIALHALYNGVLTIPVLLFGDMLGV